MAGTTFTASPRRRRSVSSSPGTTRSPVCWSAPSRASARHSWCASCSRPCPPGATAITGAQLTAEQQSRRRQRVHRLLRDGPARVRGGRAPRRRVQHLQRVLDGHRTAHARSRRCSGPSARRGDRSRCRPRPRASWSAGSRQWPASFAGIALAAGLYALDERRRVRPARVGSRGGARAARGRRARRRGGRGPREPRAGHPCVARASARGHARGHRGRVRSVSGAHRRRVPRTRRWDRVGGARCHRRHVHAGRSGRGAHAREPRAPRTRSRPAGERAPRHAGHCAARRDRVVGAAQRDAQPAHHRGCSHRARWWASPWSRCSPCSARRSRRRSATSCAATSTATS